MTWLDTAIVAVIIGFAVLLIWSRVQQQKMLDTLNEIKDFIKGIKD